jgi:insertion element IS1 protein InsB
MSCIRFGVKNICMYCTSENLIKSGKTTNQKQRYKCKNCCKRFIENYSYEAYHVHTNPSIIEFNKEGVDIRSTARILSISTTTLLKRILSIAASIPSPTITKGGSYEVDEHFRKKEKQTDMDSLCIRAQYKNSCKF